MEHSIPIPNTLLFSTIVLFLAVSAQAQAQPQLPFRCTNAGATCNSLVGYIPPNATTLSNLLQLFNVSHLRSLLGANNLPLNTRGSFPVPANKSITIPFPCSCTSNGTGIPNRPPVYTVVPGDGLDHIARDVFGALVTFPQIQTFNGLPDANKITVGQRLRIPLPCSCDEVDGKPVVHYGHVVAPGSSLPEIAQQFNTSEATLQRLNNLTDPKALQAGAVLDVPLAACSSIVRNDSQDSPLLVSNGTYVFTARYCVTCRCNASISLRLQCEPSQINSSSCPQIPPCPLPGTAETLNLGNSTTSGCNRTTCAYAGFTNQTIFTALDSESTCPATPPTSAAMSLRAWTTRATWNGMPADVFIHALLLCAMFFFSSGHI